MSTEKKQIMTLTDAAVARLQEMMSDAPVDASVLGMRLNVKTRGCSGKAYELDFVTQVDAKDEVIEQDGVMLFVDPGAVLFIIGAEMDFQQSAVAEGFVFNNPNEKGRCGCGESFHV